MQSLTSNVGGHGNRSAARSSTRASSPGPSNYPKKFRRLNEPDVSYHGVVYTGSARPRRLHRPRPRRAPAQHGRGDQPFNAFLILQGIGRWRCAWTASATTRWRSPVPAESPEGRLGQLRRPAGSHRPRLVRKYMGGRASGIPHLRRQGGRSRRHDRRASRTRWRWITAWSTSATTQSLACHPPRPRTASSGPEAGKAGVSEDMIRLSRSASSTSACATPFATGVLTMRRPSSSCTAGWIRHRPSSSSSKRCSRNGMSSCRLAGLRQHGNGWVARTGSPDYYGDLDALLAHYSPEMPVRLVGHSIGAISPRSMPAPGRNASRRWRCSIFSA